MFWKSRNKNKRKSPSPPAPAPVREVAGQEFPTMEMTTKVIEELIVDGIILNARYGGLVLGQRHDQGGIQIIRQATPELVQVIGEMEGWEYILNPYATAKHFDRLNEINAEYPGERSVFQPYKLGGEIRMLDAKPRIINGQSVSKILFVGNESQFIINRFSTMKYLDELNDLNRHWQ